MRHKIQPIKKILKIHWMLQKPDSKMFEIEWNVFALHTLAGLWTEIQGNNDSVNKLFQYET